MTHIEQVTLSYKLKSESPYEYSEHFAHLLDDMQVEIKSDIQDMNVHQYFELFNRFLLSLGFCEKNIISGACRLAFNDTNTESIMNEVMENYSMMDIGDSVPTSTDESIFISLLTGNDYDTSNLSPHLLNLFNLIKNKVGIHNTITRFINNLSTASKIELLKTTDDVEVLSVLSNDEDSAVRCAVARNPNTPVEVLRVLSTDEDSTDGHYFVRCSVALNPNTPVEVLEVLSTDEDFVVRYWVANNPNYIKEND
jgi:hypothetical protein